MVLNRKFKTRFFLHELPETSPSKKYIRCICTVTIKSSNLTWNFQNLLFFKVSSEIRSSLWNSATEPLCCYRLRISFVITFMGILIVNLFLRSIHTSCNAIAFSDTEILSSLPANVCCYKMYIKLLHKNAKLFVALIFLSLILICYYLDQTISTNQPLSVFKDVLKFKTKITVGPLSSMVGSVRAEVFLYNLTGNVKPLPAQSPSSLKRIKQFVIPPEVYDKKSPFYGMVYKDIYGLPLAAITNESFDEEVTESWTDYFPSLMSAIKNDNKLNPSHNSTYFTMSGVITLSKTNYTLNDEFEATITSLDSKGRKKTFGGDYYRARLVRGDGKYPDGIPCKVIDNSNGTYTVKAPLALEGSLTLDVKLVLTLQTIKRLINHTSFLCSNTTVYYSELESNETVPCALSAIW